MRENTRRLLNQAYRAFHNRYQREMDPVKFVHRYPDRGDQEVVALFASLLAYGNVPTILNSVEKVMGVLGKRPARFLLENRRLPGLKDFRHRFTTQVDLDILAAWVSVILSRYGFLETFFVNGQAKKPIKVMLSDFVQRLTQLPLPRDLANALGQRHRSMRYLLPDPARGSACKRLNLFLRWMVRPADGIDLGLWRSLSPSDLILPVDTHLLSVVRTLGWVASKQASWKVAEAATEELRRFCPHDPVKFDFALCHLSMSGHKVIPWRISK